MDARKAIFSFFENMACNHNRINIHLGSYDHYIMVHNIAQIALFFNGLLWDIFRDIISFARIVYNIVLMGIYHILACNKTDQQYPRTDDMIFTRFQVGKCFFYNFEQK